MLHTEHSIKQHYFSGQTKDILTQIQLTTKESRGEVKHMLNNFESIIKVAVVQAIEEEKGKHMNAGNCFYIVLS